MSALRVAVNLTWMEAGRVGGSEQYLTRQLSGVDERDLDLTVYADATYLAAHPELAERFETRTMPSVVPGRAGRIAAEHSWLALRTRDADVVHHGGGTAPLIGRRPIVLTIHDLQYLVHPDYFGATRRRYLAAMMPRSAHRAALVAVPSEAVRAHVVDAFALAPDRVVVVPHGIPEVAPPAAETRRAVRERLRIGDRPYLLYPAITHPHKRHTLLVDMLEHVDDDVALVLIGGSGHAEAAVRAAIAASPRRARIVRPGRVSDDERDALIADASALAFPSEFEGFGAPLVEAMALGTPVLCSDAPAVTEVVGDAGQVVVEPSGEAWAAGLAELERRRDDLVAAGARRREAFTIERSGHAIAAVYRQAGAS